MKHQARFLGKLDELVTAALTRPDRRRRQKSRHALVTARLRQPMEGDGSLSSTTLLAIHRSGNSGGIGRTIRELRRRSTRDEGKRGNLARRQSSIGAGPRILNNDLI